MGVRVTWGLYFQKTTIYKCDHPSQLPEYLQLLTLSVHEISIFIFSYEKEAKKKKKKYL